MTYHMPPDEELGRLRDLRKKFPFTADIYHEGSGRYVSAEISTPEKYVKTWEDGLFKWQGKKRGIEPTPKPEDLPDIELVRALILLDSEP